jgi:hypothetical protein
MQKCDKCNGQFALTFKYGKQKLCPEHLREAKHLYPLPKIKGGKPC